MQKRPGTRIHQTRLNAGPPPLSAPSSLEPVQDLFMGSAWLQNRHGLGACRTWSVESENWPQRGQFLPDLQAHSPAMGQKDGGKWTAAANLQPTISKPDRLLGARRSPYACMGKVGNDERGVFGAMPFGLPRKGWVRGVANPRRATSPAVVCASRPQPLRGNVPHEKILNRFFGNYPSTSRGTAFVCSQCEQPPLAAPATLQFTATPTAAPPTPPGNTAPAPSPSRAPRARRPGHTRG